MKKFCMVLSLAGVMAASNLYASFDGTVTLYQGSYSYGNGGEFTAVTSGLGTFQTFCIEYNEEFGPGGTYQYTQNTGAVAGGPGANATDPNTGLPMDNISIGTAWLYSQFRAGTLTLDTGTGSYFNANQQANAGELQQAIWLLEDEAGGVDNGYVTLAETALGKNLAQIEADSNGAYGVIALNLSDGPYSTAVQSPNGQTYNLNQDQLAIVPEPTTIIAGALLLLPFGASTLRILRRKIRTA
jgi:hypothetical protein